MFSIVPVKSVTVSDTVNKTIEVLDKIERVEKEKDKAIVRDADLLKKATINKKEAQKNIEKIEKIKEQTYFKGTKGELSIIQESIREKFVIKKEKTKPKDFAMCVTESKR